jgi:hypothetical protein
MKKLPALFPAWPFAPDEWRMFSRRLVGQLEPFGRLMACF